MNRGDHVPHFIVTRIDGSRAAYSEIWQRKNLVLVSLPPGFPSESGAAQYARDLLGRIGDVRAYDADCVITSDPVPNAPCPGVLVADRWGEIYFVAGAPNAAALPSAGEILDWLQYIANECPECQGETR